MKWFFLLVVLLIAGFVYLNRTSILGTLENLSQFTTMGNKMKLTSPAFANNTLIPAKYTCDGEGIHPPLSFYNVPGQTQSLALIVDDPDAPGGTFVHWVVFHILPATTKLYENSLPQDAIEGTGSTGSSDYTPPCPPSGTHRYIFTLYAIDILPPGDEQTTKDQLLQSMQGHILDSAQLIGLYKKQ